MGTANFNTVTGIHYGVISQYAIMPEAWNDFEPDYGPAICPKCGNEAQLWDAEKSANWENYRESGYQSADYQCETCEHVLDAEECFGDEAIGWNYDSDGYKLTDCLDSDIFILEAPFYTFARFCSPCVPGAGNLESYDPDGVKTYCLGHDWFDNGKAPYPVYSVETGKLIEASN